MHGAATALFPTAFNGPFRHPFIASTLLGYINSACDLKYSKRFSWPKKWEERDPSFNLNTNIEVPTPHESTPQES